MNLTKEELEALKAYFAITTINITKLSQIIGVNNIKYLNKAIDKIIDYE